MFLLGEISILGGLLLTIVVGCLALKLGAKVLGLVGRIVPMTLLGVVAVVAGLWLFASHPSVHTEPAVERWLDQDVDPDDWTVEMRLGLNPLERIRHARSYQSVGDTPRQVSTHPSRWVMIVLGTILVISGSMLVRRGRVRPRAVRVFTVLGVAAVAFALFSFLNTPPRQVVVSRPASTRGSHDRIVKNPSMRAASSPVEAARRAADAAVKASRIHRASAPAAGRRCTPLPARTARPCRRGPEKSPSRRSSVQPGRMRNHQRLVAAKPPAEVAPDEPAKPAADDAGVAAAATAAEPAPPPVSEAPATPPPSPAPSAAATATGGPRPAWIDAPPKLVNTVYSMSIRSGLYASLPECQRELDSELKRAADQYIRDWQKDEGAAELVDVSLDYLHHHVKKAEYSEVIESESVGPMHQVYALLEFDDPAREDFRRVLHDAVVNGRLWYAGSGAALVLALLGTLYGYLRLDLRTGGAHKGQLQLAATLVALVVTAGVLLVRWAVPF